MLGDLVARNADPGRAAGGAASPPPGQACVTAHRDRDAAVAAAYGWPADIREDDALARLLALNLQRQPTAQSAQER
jgi:hypothetical protein